MDIFNFIQPTDCCGSGWLSTYGTTRIIGKFNGVLVLDYTSNKNKPNKFNMSFQVESVKKTEVHRIN